MKKQVVTMILEGDNRQVEEVKSLIIATASKNLVSCSVNDIVERQQEVNVLDFMRNYKCSELV